MKTSIVLAAIVAASASSVSAYQCPDTPSVNNSCRQINVYPLICNKPNVNKDVCNARQCSQAYIDNYAACQCRRSPNMFYEHSANVEGLLRRCGLATLTNPYGSPTLYRPGQGTQTFGPITSATPSAGSGIATRINGATTWISGTPSIIRGTGIPIGVVPGTTLRATASFTSGNGPTVISSTSVGSTRSAAPIVSPTETAVPVQNQSKNTLSGGAIAGIVLGCLAALALAGLLAWCWRRKRNQHTTTYNTHSTYENRGPTRTVVTEKLEPVVVKSGTHQTYTNVPAGTSSYTTAQNVPVNSQGYSTASNAVHPSTSYNTTTTSGYNAANNAYSNAGNTYSNAYNSANNTYNNAYNTANDARNGVRGSSGGH
ncbi:hypothetical protein BGX23_012226 [Mortierella sp. AD031]|nr:hypothetical protein BGX23_012226 [Mortierella sp. AD031]